MTRKFRPYLVRTERRYNEEKNRTGLADVIIREGNEQASAVSWGSRRAAMNRAMELAKNNDAIAVVRQKALRFEGQEGIHSWEDIHVEMNDEYGKPYHVRYDGDNGSWVVTLNSRVVARRDTKRETKRVARELAESNWVSRIVYHKKNGDVQQEVVTKPFRKTYDERPWG